MVPRDGRCYTALQCQQPCAIPRESPCTGRCPVRNLVTLAAAAGAKPLPHSLGLLREKSFRLLTGGCCCCTWAKNLHQFCTSLCSPKISTKPTQGRKEGSPMQWVEMPGTGSNSDIPVLGTTEGSQQGASAPGDGSKHPRPEVTTFRMIWFEGLGRNKCCALFTTWPSC